MFRTPKYLPNLTNKHFVLMCNANFILYHLKIMEFCNEKIVETLTNLLITFGFDLKFKIADLDGGQKNSIIVTNNVDVDYYLLNYLCIMFDVDDDYVV